MARGSIATANNMNFIFVSMPSERATETKRVIEQLKSLFHDLKIEVLNELESRNIKAFELLSFLRSDSLKFPDVAEEILEKNEALSGIKLLSTVFLFLDKYWDYLNIEIIDTIVCHKLENQGHVSKKLIVLKKELQQFLANTTIKQFYDAEVRNTCQTLPNGFKEMVSTHSWSPSTLLLKVEQYRQDLKSTFKKRFLYQAVACSIVIIVGIREGSVKIVMFVPESVTESIDINFFKNNGVIELEFDEMCIYNENKVGLYQN